MSSSATVAIFAYGEVKGDTVACLVEEIRQAPDLQLWVVQNDASLWRSKARLATTFLDNPEAGDVLVTLDRDIVWQPGALSQLISKCRQTRGIVSGLYPKRAFGQGMTATPLHPGVYQTGQDVLVPALSVPGGFLAMHREALVAVASGLERTSNGYMMFVPTIVDGLSCEEDNTFCILARKTGAPVDLWLGANLHHIGNFEFRAMDAMLQVPQERDVELIRYGPVLEQLKNDARLFLQVADAGQFEQKLSGIIWAIRELWDNPDDELQWYKRQDVGIAYLYDLVGWNTKIANVIEHYTRGVAGKRVLEFGAGIGTWGLELARLGNRVQCVEPSPVLRDFAIFRARRLGLEVDVREELELGQFDIIIVWHVLEHLKNPQQTATLLASCLAPGGQVITQSDFHKGDSHPQHHELPEGVTVDDFWRNAGLINTSPNTWAKGGTVDGNGKVGIDDLREPLSDSRQRLTLSQKLALTAVQRRLDLARRELVAATKEWEQVIRECELDADATYVVSADGLVTVKP